MGGKFDTQPTMVYRVWHRSRIGVPPNLPGLGNPINPKINVHRGVYSYQVPWLLAIIHGRDRSSHADRLPDSFLPLELTLFLLQSLQRAIFLRTIVDETRELKVDSHEKDKSVGTEV